MSGDDALRALEDVTIYRNIKRATEDQIAAKEDEEIAKAIRGRNIALLERDRHIRHLNAELGDVHHNRNYAVTLFIAASKTLDHVVKDFARSAGVPEDKLRERYNMIRTQHFNHQVNEGLTQGWFQHDPRSDLSAEQKKWFVPGLDADHGF